MPSRLALSVDLLRFRERKRVFDVFCFEALPETKLESLECACC